MPVQILQNRQLLIAVSQHVTVTFLDLWQHVDFVSSQQLILLLLVASSVSVPVLNDRLVSVAHSSFM